MPKHNSSMLIQVNMHNYLYANYILNYQKNISINCNQKIYNFFITEIHKQFQASAMFDNILYKTKNDPNSGNVLFISNL